MKKSLKRLALNKESIVKMDANIKGGEGETLTITIPKTIIYKTWWYGCNDAPRPSDLCA